MNLADRIFLWAWSMAILMLLFTLTYPEKALAIREATPLLFGQLMVALIVGYPFYTIGQSLFNYFKTKKPVGRRKKNEFS